MKVTKLIFHKELKVGLPNFSNMTIGHGMEVEVGEGEVIDYDKCWDSVNQQLSIQSGSLDPSWITTGDYKNFFKVTIKTPKNGGEQ